MVTFLLHHSYHASSALDFISNFSHTCFLPLSYVFKSSAVTKINYERNLKLYLIIFNLI